MIKFKPIKYSDLNARQKEIYNFQKVAALLAEYGFNCIKLADDWKGADFLAYHIDGNSTLKIQLKGRLTIKKQYRGNKIYMAFPCKNEWYLIEHDNLVAMVSKHTNWLETKSWNIGGSYNSASPSKRLLAAIKDAKLSHK